MFSIIIIIYDTGIEFKFFTLSFVFPVLLKTFLWQDLAKLLNNLD